MLTDETAALAALDRQVAHLEWLAELAEECGFEEMAVDIRCDIAVIDGWRDAFYSIPAVLQ